MINHDVVTGSREVAWFEVYLFVAPLLAGIASWPAAGTPEWCDLKDDDPRKVAAVLEAGIHQSLRIDAEQAELADASQTISAAYDWAAIANRIHRSRGNAYIPMRRVS